jgi:MFS transporter, FSR family, fosmidomycin resistance protein
VIEVPSRSSLLRNRSLLALGLGHGVVDYCANTLPLFYPLLVATLGLSYGSVAALSTVQTFASSLSQPFFGWLSDRVGSRWLAAGSALFAGCCIALAGFAPSYSALVLLVALLGLAVGAWHPQGAKNASILGGQWRTTSLSIYMVISNVGLSAAPLITATILVPAGLRSTTLLLIPGALMAWMLMGSLRHLDKQVMAKPVQASIAKAAPIAWLGVAALGVTLIVRSWIEYALMALLPLLYAARAEASDQAGKILFLMLIMEGTGTMVGGWMADTVGRRITLVLSFLFLVPGVHFFLGASGLSAVLLAMAVGLLLGSPLSLTLAAAQEVLPSRMGMVSGIAISVAMVMGGVGVGIQGALADRMGLDASLQTMVFGAALATVASFFIVTRRR